MVYAIEADDKTQTRRILKPQPPTEEAFPGSSFGMSRAVDDGVKMYSLNQYDALPKHPRKWDLVGSVGVARDAGFPLVYDARFAVGDLLWVRETVRAAEDGAHIAHVRYPADGHWQEIENTGEAADRWGVLWGYRGKLGATVPAIHMPRWASRFTLEVTDVKVERLQAISFADAKAEGVFSVPVHRDLHHTNSRVRFAGVWNDINGAGAWDLNPWVVAPTFKVHRVNVDAFLAQRERTAA
jgi:hypothetical protein